MLELKNYLTSTGADRNWNTCKHAQMDIHTQDKHIFTSKGFPLERCCAHSVYCSPQLLISCFPSVMRGHPIWTGRKSAHKICSRTLSPEPVCTLLTSASLQNRTLSFFFLALSRSLSCLSLLFSFTISYLSHLFSYPLPHFFSLSLTWPSFFSPGSLHDAACRLSSAKTLICRQLTLNY